MSNVVLMPNVASQLQCYDSVVTTTISDLLLVLEMRLAQISVFVERCADGERKCALRAQSGAVSRLIAHAREKANQLASGGWQQLTEFR